MTAFLRWHRRFAPTKRRGDTKQEVRKWQVIENLEELQVRERL